MRELDKALGQAKKRLGLKPGDIYEDCAFHPVLCLGVDYKNDEIWGISLIDGTYPRSCSLLRCGVRKLGLQEAWTSKLRGPAVPEGRKAIPASKRWWNASSARETLRVKNIGPRAPKG